MNKGNLGKNNWSAKALITLLVVVLLTAQSLTLNVGAQAPDHQKIESGDFEPQIENPDSEAAKIAPDLEESISEAMNLTAEGETRRVIIQMKEIEADHLTQEYDSGDSPHIFITSERRSMIREKLRHFQGRLKKTFKSLGLISAELPVSRIKELAMDDDIAYISPDRAVASTGGHIETTVSAT